MSGQRPSADLAGLRAAFRELFAESLDAPARARAERAAAHAANREALLASLAPSRSLPDGYYSWCEYILKLHAELEAGVTYQQPLEAREADGLRVLRESMAEFRRQHPPCPHCGELNRKHALLCSACGQSLHEGRAA